MAAEVRAADPLLADELGLRTPTASRIRRLRSASAAPRSLAVVAGSPRALAAATRIAGGTGWRIVAISPESHDPREATSELLRRDVAAVYLAADDPPGADERGALAGLVALVAAARLRRGDLPVLLGGGMAPYRKRFDRLGLDDAAEAPVVVPVAGRGVDPVSTTRGALEALRDTGGGRSAAVVAATAAMAAVLDRRVELIDIGLDGGTRALVEPPRGGRPGWSASVHSADAALAPAGAEEADADHVVAWAFGGDRARTGDLVHELRIWPWAGTGGPGARARLALASAAIERLVGRSPEITARPTPDLVVLSGDAFVAAPPAAVALAVADALRRPGATQVAIDHARLLGPLGSIADPAERAAMIDALADDLLLPIGSVVIAAWPGRTRRGLSATGRLSGAGIDLPLELRPGTVELIDLPAGADALLTLSPPSRRASAIPHERVTMAVSGGLAGLMLDSRGLPLRLPERRDERRAALAAWQDPLWPADAR